VITSYKDGLFAEKLEASMIQLFIRRTFSWEEI
jgi:hypothetical protein